MYSKFSPKKTLLFILHIKGFLFYSISPSHYLSVTRKHTTQNEKKHLNIYSVDDHC